MLRGRLHASAGGSSGSQGPIAAGRGKTERLRSFGREVWAPYLADTLLRVFASASVSGQLGRFTRPMFDYTAGSVCTQSPYQSLQRNCSSTRGWFQLYVLSVWHQFVCQRMLIWGPDGQSRNMIESSENAKAGSGMLDVRSLSVKCTLQLNFCQTCWQVRVDLGLTSPQAQWLSRGGSGMNSHGSSDASGPDTAFSDSPFKHRFALPWQSLCETLSGPNSSLPNVHSMVCASIPLDMHVRVWALCTLQFLALCLDLKDIP